MEQQKNTIFVYASRDIAAGEEIFIRYNEEMAPNTALFIKYGFVVPGGTWYDRLELGAKNLLNPSRLVAFLDGTYGKDWTSTVGVRRMAVLNSVAVAESGELELGPELEALDRIQEALDAQCSELESGLGTITAVAPDDLAVFKPYVDDRLALLTEATALVSEYREHLLGHKH